MPKAPPRTAASAANQPFSGEIVPFERLAAQLVRQLRGKRSQNGLSRRLGYSTNVVYAWEAGRRVPTASGFLELVQRVGIDAAAAVRRFYPVPPAWAHSAPMTRPEDVARLLNDLAADTSVSRLARAVGSNRATVARWLEGATEPRLTELLRLVDATSNRLLDFVALFVDPRQLEATQAAYLDLEAQRRIAFELPLSHAVLRVLELESYRRLRAHRPGFVAQQVGISRQEEVQLLDALEKAKVVRRVEGRYVPERVLTVDTRTEPERNRALKIHWAELALARLRRAEPPGSALFSYNVFAISSAGYDRIRRLQLDYYEELRRIVSETPAADHVVLTNLQLLRLDE